MAVWLLFERGVERQKIGAQCQADRRRIALFGTRSWAWSCNQLSSIHAGPSGKEVNNRPVLELQVQPCDGKKAGFFGGRDEEELRWLATQLRLATGLAAPAAPAAPRVQ